MSTTVKIEPKIPKSKFLGSILDIIKMNNQTSQITGMWLRYWSLFVMQIMVMVAELGQIFAIGLVLEGLTKLSSGYNYTNFVWIAGAGIILGLLQITIAQYLSYAEDMLVELSYQKLLKTGIDRIINYSLNWHETQNAGNKVQIIREVGQSIPKSLVMLPQIFILMVTVIITIGYLTFVNIWLLPLGLVSIVISLSIAISTQPTLRKWGKETSKTYETIYGKIFESFNNIHVLKSSGQFKNILLPIFDLFKKVFNLEKKMLTLMSLRNLLLAYVVLFLGFVYLIYGGYLISVGGVSFALMYAGYRYLMKLSQEVSRFTRLTVELGLIQIKAERFYEIYNLNDRDAFKGLIDIKDQTINQIQLNNMSFSYTSDGQNQLSNINMTINRGQKIGLVGTTGSGKSTLAKLLSGLNTISAGEIKIVTNQSAVDFYDLSLDQWHNYQFLVAQDPELFNATISQNITLFDPVTNQSQLAKAIITSQLNSVIDELPSGLETLIGEKGYKLSGGQRQRIGIARAIYANAQIICFDESTSALDSKTEQDFQTALEQDWEDKTLIFIAHRLSTLKNVDVIYVFEHGQIIEQGSFQELIELNGKFNELWELQKSGAEL
ncbi:MAG: ABC transporter ATP-binding protein [Candidatus Parcubacteria bacterium]|nr:ABC transporter ATP-binding protein [Candidatus Paceibacterota bacterium]